MKKHEFELKWISLLKTKRTFFKVFLQVFYFGDWTKHSAGGSDAAESTQVT